MTVVSPWLLLVFGLFFYQNVTAGYNSYYLSKLLGLSLVAGGVVAATWFSIWINKHIGPKYPRTTVPILSLLIVVLVVIGTGQSTYGLNKLFQKNARTHYSTATETSSLLNAINPDKEYIVVLTNRINADGSSEDNHGKLELRVTHQRRNCAYHITWSPQLPEETIQKLGVCADKLAKKNKSIHVITSDLTKKEVESLHRPNIIVHNTKED
jgi:hypothetical protein